MCGLQKTVVASAPSTRDKGAKSAGEGKLPWNIIVDSRGRVKGNGQGHSSGSNAVLPPTHKSTSNTIEAPIPPQHRHTTQGVSPHVKECQFL